MVVNSLGLFGIRLVKINSKRVFANFVRTYKAWVFPRSREEAVLIVMLMTQS
jgi:hypothetical protein